MDIIRVLRIIEYSGPREEIEKIIEKSIQGTKTLRAIGYLDPVIIRVATIGGYPEILGVPDEILKR